MAFARSKRIATLLALRRPCNRQCVVIWSQRKKIFRRLHRAAASMRHAPKVCARFFCRKLASKCGSEKRMRAVFFVAGKTAELGLLEKRRPAENDTTATPRNLRAQISL